MSTANSRLKALEDAYYEGVTSVKYSDREVIYRSLREMKALINELKKEIRGTNGANVAMPSYDRGCQ